MNGKIRVGHGLSPCKSRPGRVG